MQEDHHPGRGVLGEGEGGGGFPLPFENFFLISGGQDAYVPDSLTRTDTVAIF